MTGRISVIGWGFAGAAATAIMSLLGVSLLEEGLMLVIAQRLVDGEHLYRDIESVTGPFPYELLALAFRIFGEEIYVARGLLAIFHGLACAAIFDWARRSGAGPFGHLAAMVVVSAPPLLFPLFSEYFYTTIACQLAMMSGYAALRGVESTRWALVCGILISLTALSKQTIGALLAFSLVAAVWVAAPRGHKLRQAGLVVAGGLSMAFLTISWLLFRGELNDAINSLVLRPMDLGETYSSPYMNFWPIGSFSEAIEPQRLLYLPNLYYLFHNFFDEIPSWIVLVTQALFGLPALVLAATVWRRVRRGPLSAALFIHSVTLIALFSNIVPRADWGHLVFVLPSAFVQAVLLMGGLPSTDAGALRRRRMLAGAMCLVVGLGSVSAAAALFGKSRESNHGPHVTQRIVGSKMMADSTSRAIRYLRRHAEADEAVFVPRAEPLIYFATDTTNPTRYGGVLTGRREEQESTILPALDGVRFMVMSDSDQALYTYYSDELPNVARYMERHFEMPLAFKGDNWIYVLERSEDRGATSIDFFEMRETGQYWTRDGDYATESALVPPRIGMKFNRRPLGIHLGERGGGVDFANVEVPPGAVFQASVGIFAIVSTAEFHEHPRNTRLVFSLARQSGGFERLHEEPVLNSRNLRFAGRSWTHLEVDLGGYAGEKVTLRLELEADRELKPELMSWWGSPRIAVRPAGS